MEKLSKSLLVALVILMSGVVTLGNAGNGTHEKVRRAPIVDKEFWKSLVAVSERDKEMMKCVEDCIYRHQMVAMGIEVIRANCQRDCKFKKGVSLLKATDSEDRIKGVEILWDLDDPAAVPYLIDALEKDLDGRTGLWAWIIPALGDLGDARAVPILIKCLELLEEDWLGREKAAVALGKIGDRAAVPALLRAAWRADTRNSAIEALVKLKDPRAIEVFISALEPDEDKEAREAAMKGLNELGTAAVPAMIEAFLDYSPEYPDTEKRLCLCDLLGKSRDERALAKLRESSLNDPDKEVRKCASKYVVRREE